MSPSAAWLNGILGLPSGLTYRRADRRRRIDRLRERMMHEQAIESDAEFRAALSTAPWRQSRGYQRTDGAPIGPHQYVSINEAPRLYTALRVRLANDPSSYGGSYAGYHYRYLDRDGWKYWIAGRFLNREPLPGGGGESDGDDQ